MNSDRTAPKTIDEYIAGFPSDLQERLQKIRMTVRKAAPDAQETIKYNMPAFTLKGFLVSFAAYKKHIGLYPVPVGSDKFNKEVSVYKAEKGTVRFPLDKPIPHDLLVELVQLRVQENLRQAAAKSRQEMRNQ